MTTTAQDTVLAPDTQESHHYNLVKRWLGIADFAVGLALLIILLAAGWTGTLRDLAYRSASQNYSEALFFYVLMLLLLSKAVDLMPIVTHQYRLEEFDKAFATMESGESGKVMMWVA